MSEYFFGGLNEGGALIDESEKKIKSSARARN
jgi:hypothetical protein